MNQLAFLIISSTPSLKNIAQISIHYIWPNKLIFSVFPYIDLINTFFLNHHFYN